MPSSDHESSFSANRVIRESLSALSGCSDVMRDPLISPLQRSTLAAFAILACTLAWLSHCKAPWYAYLSISVAFLICAYVFQSRRRSK